MKLFSKLSALLSPIIYLFVSPSFAFAVDVNPCAAANSGGAASISTALCNLTGNNFGTLIGNLLTIAFVLATLIALVFLIYGGVKWITSGGDKAGVEAARNTIVAAIVGLVIVFLSYFILNIILGLFGLSLNKLTLPTLSGTPLQ